MEKHAVDEVNDYQRSQGEPETSIILLGEILLGQTPSGTS